MLITKNTNANNGSTYNDFINSFINNKKTKKGYTITSGSNFEPLSNKFFQLPDNDDIPLKGKREYVDLVIANLLYFDFNLFSKYDTLIQYHKKSFYNLALLRIVILITNEYLGVKYNLQNYRVTLENNLCEEGYSSMLSDFVSTLGSKINDEEYYYSKLIELLLTLKKHNPDKPRLGNNNESRINHTNNKHKKHRTNTENHNRVTVKDLPKSSLSNRNVGLNKCQNNNLNKREATGYKVYTKNNDEIVKAESLFNDGEKRYLWNELQEFIREHKKPLTKNKIKLRESLRNQKSFIKKTHFGKINYAYLASIYSGKNLDKVYVEKKRYKASDICVTILYDNSGSMHGKPIKYVVDFIYNFAQILEKENIPCEILGFTTRSWKGGKSKLEWEKSGKKKNPGRLNDQRYVIYKSKLEKISTKKKNLALICKSGFLKENIDGEAIEWAYKRSQSLNSKRKYLLYFSDGVPIDEATINNNSNPQILNDHLRNVVKKVEKKKNTKLIVTGPHLETNIKYTNFIPFGDYRDLKVNLISSIRELIK